MPRGGGSRSSRAPPARSSSSAARAPPPAPAARAPPPAPRPAAPPPAAPAQPAQGGGMMAGLGATIMQGMAFGTGSAIAHRAVGAVAGAMTGGGSDQQQQQQQAPAAPAPAASYENSACQVDLTAFNRCMKESGNNVTECDFYYQALQQCQANNRY
jgi:coiled-coil-helix-coiled-coil-helix domain-containing protein 10